MTSLWAAGVLDKLPVSDFGGAIFFLPLALPRYALLSRRQACGTIVNSSTLLVIRFSDDPRQILIPITKSVAVECLIAILNYWFSRVTKERYDIYNR